MRKIRFNATDYLALGLSFLLALVIWAIYNLSLSYSDIVQCNVTARCELDGHVNVSQSSEKLAVRCNMRGLDLLKFNYLRNKKTLAIEFAPNDMHKLGPESYFVTNAEIAKHFHELFGDHTSLEYFITDTLFFDFPLVNFKKVPVEPVVFTYFKDQFTAAEPLKLVPDSVLVYGTDEQLSTISAVKTETVRLSNLDADVYGEIELKAVNATRVSTPKVEYSLKVVRYAEFVFDLPVRATRVPEGLHLRVFPSNVALTLRVPFPSDVNQDMISVTVDYFDYKNSISGRCLPHIEGLPEGTLYSELSTPVFDCLLQAEGK